MERQGSPKIAQAGKGCIQGPTETSDRYEGSAMIPYFSLLVDAPQIFSSTLFPSPPWHVRRASTVKPSILALGQACHRFRGITFHIRSAQSVSRRQQLQHRLGSSGTCFPGPKGPEQKTKECGFLVKLRSD